MKNYEPGNIAHAYVAQVKECLISQQHMTPAEAVETIHASNIYDCIYGCPYIANHYPCSSAAAMLAKKIRLDRNQIYADHRKESHANSY